jgi:hypothetical protein
MLTQDRFAQFKLWRDARGRLSALRIGALALLLLPIALAFTAPYTSEEFSARPLNDMIHRAGYWALMFVIIALAITPLRRIARFGALVDVRRMIGVGAFCYAVAHISLFIANFQQTKLDVWVPTFVAGLVGWLLGYRLMVRGRSGEPSALMLLGLTVAVTALTFICEAIGIALAFNTTPWMVLQMAFDVDLETLDVRPGWLVLAAGVAVVVLDVVRSRMRKPRARTPVAGKPMREMA